MHQLVHSFVRDFTTTTLIQKNTKSFLLEAVGKNERTMQKTKNRPTKESPSEKPTSYREKEKKHPFYGHSRP